MSFTTLAITNSVLTNIEAALHDGKEIDKGVLSSFNAAVMHLLLSGREPSNVEVSALQTLSAAVVKVPDEEHSSAVDAQADAEGGASNQESGDSLHSFASSTDEAPQPEAEEQSSGAPAPEEAGDASVASQSSVTSDAGEPAPADPAVGEPVLELGGDPESGAAAVEEVETNTFNDDNFQPQSHDEDDGA